MRRIESDKKVLEKYVGRDIPKELEEWERNTNDPTVRIMSMSQAFPISNVRIGVCKVGLRILQAHRVSSERAQYYSRCCGHDGEVAYRVEDYDAILREKWGDRAVETFNDNEFNAELYRRGRKIDLPTNCFGPDDPQLKYYDAIKFLRAALWGIEYFDLPPELVKRWMLAFRWSNIWTKAPPIGIVAFEIEDYAQRHLSRRERTRNTSVL